VSRYQKGKTNLDLTEARDSEWQWHQVGHMQVCSSLQSDNHASNPPLSFFTGQMPFLLPNQQRQSTEGVNGGNIIRTALCYVALRCLAYVQQAFLCRFTTHHPHLPLSFNPGLKRTFFATPSHHKQPLLATWIYGRYRFY